ncbi:MAG: pentapeptide repeat-containing protein [Planctomycetota bacterium]
MARLGKHVRTTTINAKASFSGKNLAGCEFVGQDLSSADFSGAKLAGARFLECDLTDASFSDADLRGFRIDACKTDRTDFKGAYINGMLRADDRKEPGIQLTGKQLVSTASYAAKDLSDCVIELSGRNLQLDFSGFDLSGSVFVGGDLSQCDFSKATIRGAEFRGCNFTSRQLHQTSDYQRRRLEATIGPTNNFDFTGLNLNGSNLVLGPGANLAGCQIRNCTLRFSGVDAGSIIETTTSYRTGWMTGIRFISVDLTGADFGRLDLTGSSFFNCNVSGVSLTNAVITGVDFSSVKRSTLTNSQLRQTWNYGASRMTTVALPADLESDRSGK